MHFLSEFYINILGHILIHASCTSKETTELNLDLDSGRSELRPVEKENEFRFRSLRVPLMEETKTQPVFEVGESEFSLLAEIGWKVGPKVMEKPPKSLHFAAKLEQGKILIFDQDLKIINTIQSSLEAYTKSEVASSGSRPGVKMPATIRSLLYVEGSKELWAGDDDEHIHIAENSLISLHKHKGVKYTLHTLQQDVHWGSSGVFTMKVINNISICSGGGNGVGLWEYDGTLLYHIITKGMGDITSLSILSGGYIIIIMGDENGKIELWDTTPFRQSRIASFTPHQGVFGLFRL